VKFKGLVTLGLLENSPSGSTEDSRPCTCTGSRAATHARRCKCIPPPKRSWDCV
jgi:hypothetical protein